MYEIRATRIERSPGCYDSVVWCSEAEAEMFSVYAGEPGDFQWVADFARYEDALTFAKANSTQVIDRVRGTL